MLQTLCWKSTCPWPLQILGVSEEAELSTRAICHLPILVNTHDPTVPSGGCRICGFIIHSYHATCHTEGQKKLKISSGALLQSQIWPACTPAVFAGHDAGAIQRGHHCAVECLATVTFKFTPLRGQHWVLSLFFGPHQPAYYIWSCALLYIYICPEKPFITSKACNLKVMVYVLR